MRVQCCSVLLRVLTTSGEQCPGVREKGGAVRCSYREVLFHVTDLKELGFVNFASGGFGAVFVNLLFAEYRPVLMHFPATDGEHCTRDVVKSPRVM